MAFNNPVEMDYTTKPIEYLDKLRYKRIIANKNIIVSPHALDHLSLRQRKVFKEEDLIHMLRDEKPRKAYLQANGRCAVYFRRADGYRKLIIEVEDSKVTIVTFIDNLEIPKVRTKNE